ncbi:leukocyte receptor cluster member 8 homolog [Diorhabda carinulata]|uniref:leukocyte receptor cluster member 8 homolog n=1 Tax=Diorhabda carinulata TaxID=1163345 RepID=UPI0025A3033D|nr:leukocyte receptor cluster member 8 homolog [Diorhabda carinulata]
MMDKEVSVSSIPPPPGTTDNPPLPPDDPPPSPPPPPSANDSTQFPNSLLSTPNWAHYYYNNLYHQQYAQYYQQYFMMPGYNYQAYQNQFNKKDDKIQPPLPPGSPTPPPPPNTINNISSPLLQTPKQFGHIRFQLNTKRLQNNSNPIMQLNNSPNSGASKKKRKRNRNNQNNELNQQHIFDTPPLPPPELAVPKPAPPPETMPPEPPLPPLPDEANPPLPPRLTPETNPQNGFTNPSDDWPESLKDYVHRSYAKCKTAIDKNQVEIILKGKITQAYQNGQLYKDWKNEPLPNIHSERYSFTGQTKTVPGQLSLFQNNNGVKKGISPGLGARLGARASTLRGKSKSSSRSRSRSPVPNKKSKSRSRSPKRNGSYSDTSTSSSEGSYKSFPTIPKKNMKNKLADRLGPTKKKNAKVSKKQKLKEKKNHFYSTFGSEVEENSEVLQQRAARFNNGKSNVNNSLEKEQRQPNFVVDKFSNEDTVNFDWSDCHIVGTCPDVEKSFLRLTKAPDPCDVRPVEVLKSSLQNVKDKWLVKQDYFYACDQLKSIRQDLTVQGVRNEFTVEVYETHARIALEKGDHEEFNQCQTQLKMLYNEIGGSNRNEFVAYRILYYIFTKNTLDIMTILKSLTKEEKLDPCISFALKIRSAWGSGNFHKFFTLYCKAPLMTGYLIDWFIERERKDYLKCIIKSYRQNVSIDFLMQELAFKNADECLEFVDRFSLIFADTERTLIDCKSSTTALPNI